jgi:threonine dehydrogenase-like Zn-dependent dehydrogenase
VKALQFQAIDQVNLVEIDVPQIGEDELLIKTGATTICTSDLNDIRENPFGIELPVVLGHEGAGTVVAVGSAVTSFRVGDRVAAHPVHPCGQCNNCRRGWGHLCASMVHFGLNRPGTFAEYFPVRADRARQIPDTVPFPVAALVEPVSVCLEALAQANLPQDSTLLIIGDGPFGVLMTRLAASLPLQKCVLAGEHDFRLGKARNAVRINVSQVADPLARLHTEANGDGYDAAILAVSSANALRQGLALLRPKGRMVVFSAIPGETPIDLFDLHLRELEIVGACSDQDRFDQAVGCLSDPAPGLEDLVTHTFPLQDYRAALSQAATRHDETLKVAFVFAEEA